MTQRQRRVRAQRAGARRRKVNAAVIAWKKMNPGKKLPAAVRVKRLTGGGFSVIPVKVNRGFVVGGSQWVGDRPYAKRLAQTYADQTQRPVTVAPVDERGYHGRVIYTAKPKLAKRNAGPLSFRKGKKIIRKHQKLGYLEPGPMPRKWRRIIGVSKTGRRRSR